MNEAERALMQRWVDAWKAAGPELERMRAEEIRQADTQESIEALSGMFEHARRTFPVKESSGLVEQQRWFRMLVAR